MGDRLLKLSLLIACIAGAIFVLAGLFENSMTLDEPFHLSWNERFLDTDNSERLSIHNYNSPSPILQLSVLSGRWAQRYFPKEYVTYLIGARFPIFFCYLGLIYATFVLGRQVYGFRCGALAAIFVALEPNVIAHSGVATSDIPFAFFSTAFVSAFISVARTAQIWRSVFAGALLGLACALKVTGAFYIIGIFPLLFCMRKSIRQSIGSLSRFPMLVGAALLGCWVAVCAVYRFIGVEGSLGEITFVNPLFIQVATWFPTLPSLFPAGFLSAYDICLNYSEGSSWNVRLFHSQYPTGTLVYYPVVWFFKSPVVLLTLVAFSVVTLVSRLRLMKNDVACSVFIQVLLLVSYFLFFFRVQVGFRHVLMCVPLMAVLVSYILSATVKRRMPALAFVSMSLFILELYPFAGNPLSFSNLLLQPKKEASYFLTDSNIDWGQRRSQLWTLKQSFRDPTWLNPFHILPGRNMLGVNQFVGVFWNFEQHRWLRENVKPDRHVNHSHLIFNVSTDVFHRFLQEARRVPGMPFPHERCKHSFASQENPEKLTLTGHDNRKEYVCAFTREPLQVQLEVMRGGLRFGSGRPPHACGGLNVGAAQEAWYLLDPGYHRLCIRYTSQTMAFLSVKTGEPENMFLEGAALK